MKLFIPIVILSIGIPLLSTGQIFENINESPIAVSSDSRSVNFIDINNDGWQDLFITNGPKSLDIDLLYLNDGEGNFIYAPDKGLSANKASSVGAAFGDLNGDGRLDGVVSTWYGQKDLVYFQSESGAYEIETNKINAKNTFAEGVVIGDFDGDNLLDIYITTSEGDKRNILYHNKGGGSFEETSNSIVAKTTTSRGAIFGDFNLDGIQDLFVVNENKEQNLLYFGQGNGIFERHYGDDLSVDNQSSITASWGDVDNDGDLDVFVGNSDFLIPEVNKLYINENNESWSVKVISDFALVNSCTFGSTFGDFDNDGDLDLIVSNGFCNSNQLNNYFENDGKGNFSIVYNAFPSNRNTCSYGTASADINNDGFLDVVFANCQNINETTAPPNSLYINKGNEYNWIQINLKGEENNTYGVGSVIKLYAEIAGEKILQLREITTQSGYSGQNGFTAHFGLHAATKIDSIHVLWPNKKISKLIDVDVNQILSIQEPMISGIGSVNLVPIGNLIKPNPAGSGDTICITNPFLKSDLSTIRLYSGNSSEILKSDVTYQGYDFELTLPGNLLPGLYILQFTSDKGESIASKIMVF